jgi:hypothetical protein
LPHAHRSALSRSCLGLVAVLTCVFSPSCGGGSSGSQNNEITTRDLKEVVVSRDELRGEFAALPKMSAAAETNASVAADTIDPSDTAETIAKAGRTGGYSWGYLPSDAAWPVLLAGVDLFDKEESASAFVSKQFEDWSRFRGEDIGRGLTIDDVKRFDVPAIGSGTVGFETEQTVMGSGEKLFSTLVQFHEERLAGFVAIIRADQMDSRREAERVAKLLDERMQAILNRV